MSEGRCPRCGGYNWGNGKCIGCNYVPKTVKPRFDMSDKVDIFKLARLLRQKEEKKKEEERKAKIPQLTSCLQCYEPSLFYDSIHDQFECLNLKCKIYSSPILFNTEEYNSVIAILP